MLLKVHKTDNCKSCQQSDHSSQGDPRDQSEQSEKSLRTVKLWMVLIYAHFNQALRFCGFCCSGSVTLIKKGERNKKL